MGHSNKNTVSAKGQLKENEYVTYIHGSGEGVRILFVGNSITLHGRKDEIGWTRVCGMAASEAEKDYVHLLKIKEK